VVHGQMMAQFIELRDVAGPVRWTALNGTARQLGTAYTVTWPLRDEPLRCYTRANGMGWCARAPPRPLFRFKF